MASRIRVEPGEATATGDRQAIARADARVPANADAPVTGIHLRAPVAGDQAYIASTLVSSLGMADNAMSGHERGLIADRLLDKAGVRLAVASDITNTSRILGWICYSPMPIASVLHYVYVRNQARRQGIATALAHYASLTDGRPIVYTLAGPSSSWLLERYHAAHMPIAEFLS